MDLSGYGDIIFFAALAGVILWKLRSVLGRKGGKETITHQFPWPQNKKEQPVKRGSAEVLPSPAHPSKKPLVLEPQLSPLSPEIAKELEPIKALDRSFNHDLFLSGAKSAFEFILSAYAKRDKNTLRRLLDKDLFESFSQSIDAREAEGKTLETSLLEIVSAEIAGAEAKKPYIYVTVKFSTEQINLVKDKDGNLLEGDPSEPEIVEDEWTFRRDTTSPDPNWVLADTGMRD